EELAASGRPWLVFAGACLAGCLFLVGLLSRRVWWLQSSPWRHSDLNFGGRRSGRDFSGN
ncbi:hypothetical protein E2562_037567, partial [Oryza meyeriana var. granulata]